MLLERVRECGQIEAAIGAAEQGHSTVLVIRADAGLGKTALLQHARARADGMQVLSCRGFESESQLAFAGIGDLLRPAAGYLDGLPDPQRRALAGALAVGPPVESDRLTVFVGILSMLAAIAEERPLLALVDDAHWLDHASAEGLAFAGRRLSAEGVVLLLATRDKARSNGFDAFPAIDLEPLTPAAARDLVGPVLPSHSAGVDQIVAVSGGNPLALIELARAARAQPDITHGDHVPLPDGIRSAYVSRIERLPSTTRRALLVAAAADNDDAAMVARALAVHQLGLADLEPAEQAGLVELSGNAITFSHPLLRSAAYTLAGAADRRGAHAALAAAMDESGFADRRAWHRAAAAVEADEEIAAALEASGRSARSSGGYASAVAAFERSASMSPERDARAGRLVLAAEAAHLVGDSTRSSRLLAEAEACVGTDLDLAAIERLRARVEAREGSSAAALDLLRSAALRLQAVSPEQAALALIEAVEAAIRAGEPRESLVLADRAMALAGEASDAVAVFAVLARAAACIFLGDTRQASALTRGAVASARETALDERIRGYLGMVLAFNEEFDDARSILDGLVQQARRQAAPGALEFPLVCVGWVNRTTGRWSDAVAALYESVELASELARGNDECWALSVLSWIEAAQGRDESCRAHIDRQIALQERLGLPFQLAAARSALGLLDLGAGRVGEAAGQFAAALEVKRRSGYCDATTYPPATPDLVEALMRTERRDDARAECERFGQEAEASGRASAAALAHRCRGLVAGEAGFEEPFEAALAAHADARDPFARARTELCYGTALRRAGRRRESRLRLTAALETFEACRAAPWSALAMEGLDRSAQTLRSRDHPAADDLTPAEWQVCAAVEQGLTNKEIGAQLFMSHKTVEAHLTHTYNKLGLRRRTELARWFREQRPPERA